MDDGARSAGVPPPASKHEVRGDRWRGGTLSTCGRHTASEITNRTERRRNYAARVARGVPIVMRRIVTCGKVLVMNDGLYVEHRQTSEPLSP